MDLAKLDNRQFNLNESIFDLSKTVVQVLDMVSYQAQDRKVTLLAAIDDP